MLVGGWLQPPTLAAAGSVQAAAAARPQPTPTPAPAQPTAPASGGANIDQQCGGITDPVCYVIDAFVSGPVALMGDLDGSPDPAHINPTDGAVTSGPWQLITTLVGDNPAVDSYNGDLGEPAHNCGPRGCIPWVQQLNSVFVPLSLSLLVLAFALQVCLFMVGQELNLRAGIVPCLIAAAVIGAGLPLHLAGRLIDLGSWGSQALVQQTFGELGRHGAQPLDMMTVLAMTAYCPEDSPVTHPGIHISWPGNIPRELITLQPWLDRHFHQSHCISSQSPDFTKEVLDRSENFFGPPLHDANCDRGDADPGQPLCTDTDNQVNDNADQDCIEGSGSLDIPGQQLHLLPLPGEPLAGNGQNPADCRYADIYWGTVPSFTDVWAGVGAHGRNGYDVPDGLQGMVAFTVLTLLGLWLALTYLARYLVLAILAGCSSLSFVLLAMPGGRGLFSHYWRLMAQLSAVVVVQTLVFLIFVAIVSTVSGLAPGSSPAGCPLIAGVGAQHCAAGAQGLLAEVGRGNPGNQFPKCLLAIVTVWLMLELPKRISRTEMSSVSGLRALLDTSGGVVLGGAMLAVGQTRPRVGRFGARLRPAASSLAGAPTQVDHQTASELEQAERTGSASWPLAPGRETRAHFVGRMLARDGASEGELQRLLGRDPEELRGLRARLSAAGRQPPRDLREDTERLGREYVQAQGRRVHDLDAAYLRQLRSGRLRPLGEDSAGE